LARRQFANVVAAQYLRAAHRRQVQRLLGRETRRGFSPRRGD
jgi:hypothetical protein